MISGPNLVMFVSLFFLLLLTDGASTEKNDTDKNLMNNEESTQAANANTTRTDGASTEKNGTDKNLMNNEESTQAANANTTRTDGTSEESSDEEFMNNEELIDAVNASTTRKLGGSSKKNCSYQDVIRHLGLTYEKKTLHMTRPVTRYTTRTHVYLKLVVYAILEVTEKNQRFVPYVWMKLSWQNELTRWKPEKFCGITNITVPTDLLWKPDLTIEEMIEKDVSQPNSYLTIRNKGKVTLKDNKVLVSTCRMQVYRFPFDTQSCNLTFKSLVYSDSEIRLFFPRNMTKITEDSRNLTYKQSEWELISITTNNSTTSHHFSLIYTIKIRRRSALYVVNFILPILFFLCLDLASFLIADSSGEKLSFKVTVLLAVTVMQLILNEILPSSSDWIPLIAIYCIGIFGLMMLSLLETILVMYLMEKDKKRQDNETDEDWKLSEDKHAGEVNKLVHSSSGCDVSPIKTPCEMLLVAKEDSNTQRMEMSLALDELRNLIKTPTPLPSSCKEEAKPGNWTMLAKRINQVFFICYVSALTLFLAFMFVAWTNET